ncbi:uncharacterized protein DS421_17g580650 [Arachis hypogaea]|nr:uncharacterized protein DS421_17g580650 [Arachis hypogaea]
MLCLLKFCFPLFLIHARTSSYGKLCVGGSPLSMATIHPSSEKGPGALSPHG